jgi:hypothetical protein
MNFFSRPFAAVAVLCVVGWSAPVQESPAKVRVAIVKVKPEMVSEFRELQAQATAAYKKMGAPFRDAWMPGPFGDQSTWAFVTLAGKLADYDSPPIMAAMGKDAYEQWLAKATKCVTDVRYAIWLPLPELTLESNSAPGGFIYVANVTVASGKEGAFESNFKNIVLPALRKAGVKEYWVSRTLYGDTVNTYHIASPLASLGDLEQGTVLQRALGADAYQRWREVNAGIVLSVSIETYKYVPELSYAPSK